MERNLLVKKAFLVAAFLAGIVCSGCKTIPSAHIGELALGMEPAQVKDIMGPPFTVRASKQYENGESMEVWEYIAPYFSLAAWDDKYDKTYWIVFENGKVVQWGEPGDFSGLSTAGTAVPVGDYTRQKTIR